MRQAPCPSAIALGEYLARSRRWDSRRSSPRGRYPHRKATRCKGDRSNQAVLAHLLSSSQSQVAPQAEVFLPTLRRSRSPTSCLAPRNPRELFVCHKALQRRVASWDFPHSRQSTGESPSRRRTPGMSRAVCRVGSMPGVRHGMSIESHSEYLTSRPGLCQALTCAPRRLTGSHA
jgi:hypothetical protein